MPRRISKKPRLSLAGRPGVGKTTLGLQFLLQGVRQGETAMYITLSETRSELQAVAKSHHWDISKVHIFQELVGEGSLEEDETTVFYPSEIELGETIKAMLEEVDRIKPNHVVLDSLSEIRLLVLLTDSDETGEMPRSAAECAVLLKPFDGKQLLGRVTR